MRTGRRQRSIGVTNMNSQQSLAERFREQNRAGCLLLPKWDAASARIFEDAGFNGDWDNQRGHCVRAGASGRRAYHSRGNGSHRRDDRESRLVSRQRRYRRGYGPGPADVATTVGAVLDVGVVGINIEDNTHGGNPARLFGINEQCARIAAAREVAERRRIPLVINARTDTFLLGLGSDVEERVRLTVERGLQDLRAGADLIFVPLLVDVVLVKRLGEELQGRISLMALPGAPPAQELFAAGAARVSIGQMAMLATLGSLKRIGDELHQHGTWRSIEESFYGFGEAEALFSQRPPDSWEGISRAHGSVDPE